ncbi:MarR family winged helix-turn-helix transcriptional regulator [Hyphomonas sp. WL0036]|uniref:MarR family winged helix-turn-helix transcriptional regulator n=1 Tax=Hyphomonas sediminis TaxID=2866160 RepID=UPI001C7F9B72|nr:MarR family winged helix-turn-helix transcriptional regulator [Hyphomonas sediminis]MBY9067007.1 MarR family winged helix-turn-helix transcriptional regulator [Hyphomonas sediminis]
MKPTLPVETTLEVYNRCLCFSVHKAARALARRFDAALAPLGISHGQYSLMMSLNRPDPPRLGEAAAFLVMDRTTLTANLKPLERMGYVETVPDKDDKRSRRLLLTDAGRQVLAAAVPIWRATHDEVDGFLSGPPSALRANLMEVAEAA